MSALGRHRVSALFPVRKHAVLVLAVRWTKGRQHMWVQHLVPKVRLCQKRKVKTIMGPKPKKWVLLHISEPFTTRSPGWNRDNM